MKKLLALTLAAALSLSLAACGESFRKETEPPETLPLWAMDPEQQAAAQASEAPQPVMELTEAPETEPTVQIRETAPELTETTAPETEETTLPPETEPKYRMEDKFEPVEETVYARKSVNIRTQGNVNSASLGKLGEGKSVLRIGISEDGWSAVLYDDAVCYIASEYLTTEEHPEPPENPNIPKEEAVDDMVYTVDDVNMREGPGFDRAILCRVPEFVELHRTGIVSSGWSKVTYKDQEGYISTGYLAEKHPALPPEDVTEEEVDDTVYTTREVNLRKWPGTDKAILGRIPEGTELHRTAVTDNGWGKVSYEGMTGYVSGDYLTTDSPS